MHIIREEQRGKDRHGFSSLGQSELGEVRAQAAQIISKEPSVLQLRYLQTLADGAGERTSTIIPLPMDVFRSLADTSTRERR